MQRIDLDRELAEARLQVMQAQVEPHFLFNTLANVRRLFQTDPPAAHAMLEHLSRYLSAMLPRMRSAESTLGQELALALAYLHVQTDPHGVAAGGPDRRPGDARSVAVSRR